MPTFICSKCRCLENTASSNFWLRKAGELPLCSLCDPKIGKWHGLFERREATEEDIEKNVGYWIRHKDIPEWYWRIQKEECHEDDNPQGEKR